MQCNHAQKQLNALADGELNRWQRSRIDRHLRRCPACADELAAIRLMGDQAKAWRRVTAPATLHARIVQTLANSQANDSSLSSPNEEISTMHTQTTVLSSPQNLYRIKLNWRPVAALSGLGVALAVMALFLLPTRKSFAFAAVIQAMQQVNSVHWTIKVNGVEPPEEGIEDSKEMTVMEAWARLDKPALALLIGGEGEVKMLLTPNKHSMITDGKILMELPMPPLEGKDKEAGLRDAILEQLVLPTKEAAPGAGRNGKTNLLKTLMQNDHFQKEEVILEGRRVIRFSSDEKLGEGRFRVSLWVDSETRLILQSETRISNQTPGQPDIVTLATQFRYNEEPPVGVFDLPAK